MCAIHGFPMSTGKGPQGSSPLCPERDASSQAWDRPLKPDQSNSYNTDMVNKNLIDLRLWWSSLFLS